MRSKIFSLRKLELNYYIYASIHDLAVISKKMSDWNIKSGSRVRLT